MGQSKNITLRVDQSLRERVEEFKDSEGFEHLSQAGQELVEVGLRERQHPVIWRAKDRIVDWANTLVVMAAVVATLGATTGMYRTVEGVLAGIVLLALSSMLLASLEVARGVAGMNPMGLRVRELLRRGGQS